MTPERHARVKELFLAALRIPPGERGSWLDTACADNPSLRPEVEQLLAQVTATGDSFGATGFSAVPAQPVRLPASEPESVEVNRPGSMSESSGAGHNSGEAIKEDRPTGDVVAGRYRIVSRLGAGGMGIVYRAEDMTLHQTVALKFLPPSLATHALWLNRMRHEARLARTITHPNVCRMYDVGEDNGVSFLSMEFVSGEDLASLLRRVGRLSMQKAIQLSREICAGLAAAHSAGVLHRDLKPANIMIDEKGNARITDFGMAGLSGHIDPREIRAGTPAYMAPEQIAGREVTTASDIYALGLVLYELFTGRRVYEAHSLDEYLRLHEQMRPRPPSEVVDDVPADVERIVLRCLEKDPARRPPSSLHVAAALPETDVLSMALASGITPMPDLIAAASTEFGGARSRTKWLMGGFLLLTAVVVLRSARPLPWDDLGTIPPAALAERARRILEAADLAIAKGHEAYGFCTTIEAWREGLSVHGRCDAAPDVVPVRPFEPCFFYRQSERSLVPTQVENVFWSTGFPTPGDPARVAGATRSVLLNKKGELILVSTRSVGSQKAVQRVALPCDWVWDEWLEAAGMRAAQASQPEMIADHPEESGRCRCVLFRTLPSQTAPVQVARWCADGADSNVFLLGVQPSAEVHTALPDADDITQRTKFVLLIQRTLFLLLMAVTLPCAIGRLRGGRLDYRDALTLAALVMILEIAASLLRLNRSLTLFDTVARTALAVVRGAGVAALLGLSYWTLDTYARRLLPHLLVTWNRLFQRQWRDRDVRRHVVIGACVGCWWALMVVLERTLVQFSGLEARPVISGDRTAEKLHGLASGLASVLGGIEQAIMWGLLFLLLLVTLRSRIRSSLGVGILCSILLAAALIPRGAHPGTAGLVWGLGGAVVAVWIMMRYGLLAIVTAVFVFITLNHSPLSIRAATWSASIGIAAILIAAGLLACGLELRVRAVPGKSA